MTRDEAGTQLPARLAVSFYAGRIAVFFDLLIKSDRICRNSRRTSGEVCPEHNSGQIESIVIS
ncbi:hypothetical protein [Rhizobium sp. AN5]|uniref:hypothetical protein n=1 Tax=Rhizobium sp. AN5 TaxID=1855304 RepID=UPI000BE2A0B1|nr:hypothetical protein [Rhizobium sp. AN5]